ncbi:hypothetical protein KZ810_15835 [Sphingomonas sp. RHCKR47]|uniref:hypothetical protein n=1 Tax=Sphingomonas citricola TaxID=2862498 RepID=UPI001CA55AA6|nr:hypothetical protein [Sphingomonas citricola]MBW6524969.1 hypothetical protein [Sphingomonas citricola]
MIQFLALLAAQAAGTPPTSPTQKLDACVTQARTDPAGAEQVARTLGRAGEACRGVALAGQDDFAGAATAFTAAARNAELAKEARAADYWAQAGNAWLAAGDAAKARAALDAALAAGTLTDLNRGEAYLDRARALVATGDMKAARVDLDLATKDAADDPLAWLLSATLARRMGDLPRAKLDIAQALRRSADDASVQLEAGNIAAAAGEADRAQAAWKEAARLAPDAPAGRSATNALTQFAGDPKK